MPTTSKGTWGRRAASCPIPAGKRDHVHGRTPLAGGTPDLGRSWGDSGEKSSSAWGPARCPQGLSESVQTRGSGGPTSASRSGLGHWCHCQPAHGPREGVSGRPGLQPEVFLTAPGCRAPWPFLACGSALIRGLASQTLQGLVASLTGRLGGNPPRPGPACDFSRAHGDALLPGPALVPAPDHSRCCAFPSGSLGGPGLSEMFPESILCFSSPTVFAI